MDETVTLTTSVTTTTIDYHVDVVVLRIDDRTIQVHLKGTNGEAISKSYDATTTPTGATLLHALNVGNFSGTSLLKAIYNRLIADGVISGTVSGTAV